MAIWTGDLPRCFVPLHPITFWGALAATEAAKLPSARFADVLLIHRFVAAVM